MKSLPDWQLADTLPIWESVNIVADGVSDPNTMRGMGIPPVNQHQVSSMVGKHPTNDDEFVVTHITKRQGKTSDDH